jgi:hypothetical protein
VLKVRYGSFPDLATAAISRKLQPAGESRWQASELPEWVETGSSAFKVIAKQWHRAAPAPLPS